MMGVTTWTAAEDDLIVAGMTAKWSWGRIAEQIPAHSAHASRLRAQRLGLVPPRQYADDVPCPISASRDLLERMEASFANAARKWGVDYLDARTMLMNCAGVV